MRMHPCLQHAHMCAHAYTRARSCARARTHTHTRARTHTHTHMHAHTLSLSLCLTHTHTHTHTHAHTVRWKAWLSWSRERSLRWLLYESRMWMNHVKHINESCRAYEWVLSRIWMSHRSHMWTSGSLGWLLHESEMWMNHVKRNSISPVTHMNGSLLTHVNEQIVEVIAAWVTNVNQSCHTYQWVLSRIWKSSSAHVWLSRSLKWFLNESLHTCERDTLHMCTCMNKMVTNDSRDWFFLSISSEVWFFDRGGSIFPHHGFSPTIVNKTCHADARFLSHTYEWVLSHIWMSPVTHVN